jgi:hypothetical protein
MSLYVLKNSVLYCDDIAKQCPEKPPMLSQTKLGAVEPVFFPCTDQCAKFELIPAAEKTDQLRKHFPFCTLHCCGRTIELREVIMLPQLNRITN